jgi:hypothetical protein
MHQPLIGVLISLAGGEGGVHDLPCDGISQGWAAPAARAAATELQAMHCQFQLLQCSTSSLLINITHIMHGMHHADTEL